MCGQQKGQNRAKSHVRLTFKKKKKKKKKKFFFFWEFSKFRFKSAIPRIPRLFRDRGKSLALSTTAVRCAVGVTEGFEVTVGLHQGSALSPCLFAMVMDRMTDDIREEAPWTMMFADDIVICSESKEQVEEKLESWRYALERRGMKVNRRKTEYMCVNERQDTGSGTVKMQGEEVTKVDDFKYLGSTVQSNGECGREVKKRVQAGWNGWRRMSGVICDRRVPARVKGKVYKVAV